MDALASISGLATGIDFRGLVNQIIQIESKRLDSLRLGITRSDRTKDAWGEVRSLLETLRGATRAVGSTSGVNRVIANVSGGVPGLIQVEAGEGAAPGRHTVRVLERAQSESLGSDRHASRSAALGISGRFLVGGAVIDVTESDSLDGIAAAVNATNSGASPSGVTASIVGVGGAFRMVLAAARTGAEGMQVRDVSGVLTELGFFDGTTVLANRTSGGFASDSFTEPAALVGESLGFTTGAPSGTVTLGSGAGAFTVDIDLSTMSLADVRDAINSAATVAGSSMRASVEIAPEGGTARLLVEGTAAAEDSGGVLQALGVLEGGRSAVRHRLLGGALTVDAGGNAASESSLLTSLFGGGTNAGVVEGDTLTFEGVRNDGSSFLFVHTVAAGDTLRTLADRLAGADGFDGSATVGVTLDGRMEITAVDGGTSLVRLNAYAGNEAGGRLDLGMFEVAEEGRRRELTAGRDALVEVNSVLVSSASNELTGVLPGLSLSLRGADPGQELEVLVTRDLAAGVQAVRDFMDAYNAVAALAEKGVGVVGDRRPPLAGDALLVGVRRQLRAAMDTAFPGSAAGGLSRLSDIGISLTRQGRYVVDESLLNDALRTDAGAVLSLLAGSSAASTPSLRIVGSSARTVPGSYAVEVTQLAARAQVTSVGFSGLYVDDGVPDRLIVDDSVTQARYEIALADGMSTADIVDALRDELRRSTRRELASERTWYTDAAATTVATEETPLSQLHHASGGPAGFVTGTTVTFSGMRAGGQELFGTFDVTDPETQTVGSLLARARSVLGREADISLEDGRLMVRARTPGASGLAFTVGADIPGNAAPLGEIAIVETGRAASTLSASVVNGQLNIQRSAFGAGLGFTVSLEAGGGDGTSGLGLATGSFDGVDVAGTIGGQVTVGAGDRLTGGEGSGAEGLVVRVTAGQTGLLGMVTFMPGIGGGVERVLEQFLGPGSGSIDALRGRLDESRTRLERRLEQGEARLEDRRARLITQFANLERLIARSQAQSERLSAQLASLPGRRERA